MPPGPTLTVTPEELEKRKSEELAALTYFLNSRLSLYLQA